MISCNYSVFTGVKYDNYRTVFQREYDTRRLNKHVAGDADRRFLACISRLLLLVLLLSENVSAANP
jgi:hypothetical protein